MKSPFLIPIVCFILGILISGIPAVVLGGKILFVILTLELISLSLAVFITKKYVFYFLLSIYFLTLGIFRFSGFLNITGSDISRIVSEEEETCLVYGAVVTEPELKNNFLSAQYVFSLKPERILINEKQHDVTGFIQVRLLRDDKSPKIGDVVFLGGKIKTPHIKTNPYQFDHSKYLMNKGIRAVLTSKGTDHYLKDGELNGVSYRIRRMLSEVRNRASALIDKKIGGIAGGIFKAIILGLRDGVPAWVNDIFIRTGTVHILAISGLHIGILMFIVFKALRYLRITENVSCIVTICFILLFACFAGARSSLIRAAVMGTFLMLGVILRRDISSVYTLLFSAFVILFTVPGQIFNSGFILSYCAVLSILFIVPVVDDFFGKDVPEVNISAFEKLRSKCYQLFSVSVSVWIGIMPLIAYYFGILTPFVFLMNFIAIPFLLLIIVLGVCFFVFYPISACPVSYIPVSLIRTSVSIFLKALKYFVKIPVSFIKIASPVPGIIIVYYALLFVVIILWKKDIKKRVLLPAFLIMIPILFICSELSAKDPGTFTATFFDAGKADAALLEFPDNSIVLVDGGTGEGAFSKDTGKEIIEPYLRNKGIRNIDAVILSHPHEDHIGGLFHILENFKVGTIITADWEELYRENNITDGTDPIEMFRKIKKTADRKGVKFVYVKSGDVISGIKDVDFEVFNPDTGAKYSDLNNASVVVKLTDKYNNSILFCGDAKEKAIKDILCFGGRIKSDYMKFPHHGGHIGGMEAIGQFLINTDCSACVITNKSCENVNAYIIETLEDKNIDYFVSGEDGAVTFCEKDNKLYPEDR